MKFPSCRTLLGLGAVLGILLPRFAVSGIAQEVRDSALPQEEVQPVRENDPGPGQGVIRGQVLDEASQVPVQGAAVRILELGRSSLTRTDGAFYLMRVPVGSVTISVRRMGYAPAERTVEVAAGETTTIEIQLPSSALEIPGILVTGAGRERVAAEAYRPTAVVEGAELRRRLGNSVAATVAGEAGISQRYNGPAAAQPVIRGLSGDRVLLLEDGNRTGDIAATSADHAITVEPITAERIEVVRGPMGLLYGSNALGGVINVIRDEVPRSLPEGLSGSLGLQAETVNRGLVAGGTALGSIGAMALRAEASGRRAQDTRTPLGPLPSTELSGHNLAAGVSRVSDRAFAGVAVREYSLRYGVPGSFEGQAIPGAHDGGVGVKLRRSAVRLDAGAFPTMGPFHAVEASGTFVRFDQDELEHVEGREIVGTEFGQLMGSGRLVAHHHHDSGGLRLGGAAGTGLLWKDFGAAGNNTGSRPARELTLAGFGYEELGLGRLRLQAGLRYDWTRITPLDTASSPLVRAVRTRKFGAVSGSLASLYEVAAGITAGASLARSFRTPAIEELFSDGPHLASHSFEIGNPSLKPEFGLGTDLFVRLAVRRATAELTLFRNHVRDFLHYTPTGDLDPRLGRYPVYRATQADAVLQGMEGEAQWEILYGLVLGAQASYVRGARPDDGTPLPAMPPLQGGLSVRFERPAYFGGLEWTAGAAQHRTGEFESPTDAYSLLNAHAGARWLWRDRLHTVTVAVGNLTDAIWRDHLSRIREVAPQPGRNVRLLYRVEL